MNSYASDVKKELTLLPIKKEDSLSELVALIKLNGNLNLLNHNLMLNIQTENPSIARRIYKLIEINYHIKSNIIIQKKRKLNKRNIYIVKINNGVNKILNDLNISLLKTNKLINQNILNTTLKKRAFLRGAFLAGGSVNNPEKSTRYHLEIYSLYKEHIHNVLNIMNFFKLNAHFTKRRSGYIVYIKESEKISYFLQLIGATNSMLKFEDIRIIRDMRNSVNRLVNCETANLNKTINAAQEQINNINIIKDKIGLNNLPLKLKEIAIVRLSNPDVSLKELGQLLPSGKISKSGVNHRLRKINNIVQKLNH